MEGKGVDTDQHELVSAGSVRVQILTRMSW